MDSTQSAAQRIAERAAAAKRAEAEKTAATAGAAPAPTTAAVARAPTATVETPVKPPPAAAAATPGTKASVVNDTPAAKPTPAGKVTFEAPAVGKEKDVRHTGLVSLLCAVLPG